MEDKNARIFISSMSNIHKRMEFYGDVNLDKIALLKLIYTYACYSTEQEQLDRLDGMVSEIQRTDDNICLEIQSSFGSEYVAPRVDVVVGEGATNMPPSILNCSISVDADTDVYTFSYNDLFSGYTDDSSTEPKSFVIRTLPDSGSMKYNGLPVIENIEYENILLLSYERGSDSSYVSQFDFRVYDNDPELPLFSNTATCIITVEEKTVENQPPTVGDRTQYAENRKITIFTVADFTTNADPAYYDPENNPLDAIRIDSISNANDGVLYYFGSPVQEGQVITADEIANGAFYHEGPDENTINSDSFELSVRDTGSMIWVQ